MNPVRPTTSLLDCRETVPPRAAGGFTTCVTELSRACSRPLAPDHVVESQIRSARCLKRVANAA